MCGQAESGNQGDVRKTTAADVEEDGLVGCLLGFKILSQVRGGSERIRNKPPHHTYPKEDRGVCGIVSRFSNEIGSVPPLTFVCRHLLIDEIWEQPPKTRNK